MNSVILNKADGLSLFTSDEDGFACNSYSLPKGREYVTGSVWLSACYPSRLHSFQDIIYHYHISFSNCVMVGTNNSLN